MSPRISLAAVAGIPVLALGLAAAYHPSPTLGQPISDREASQLRGGSSTCTKADPKTCGAPLPLPHSQSFCGQPCASANYYQLDLQNGTDGFNVQGDVYCANGSGNCADYSNAKTCTS